jgi:hypothetical protein
VVRSTVYGGEAEKNIFKCINTIHFISWMIYFRETDPAKKRHVPEDIGTQGEGYHVDWSEEGLSKLKYLREWVDWTREQRCSTWSLQVNS